MLQTLAVQNYRTLRDLVVPLGPLNLITGANGSGKSNICKALRLLAETAQGGVIASLGHDGSDLAAALQTIREIGDSDALDEAVDDAFPGAVVTIESSDGRFETAMQQHGLLRPLKAIELSDGTLRYLLWIAALLSPRPPELLVLNEPETSLHPDLLPALGRLIGRAAASAQVFVVSHASRLIATLEEHGCQSLALEKELGETRVIGMKELDRPSWHWVAR